jgi:putative spermidine/putrescine transport system ATP-binding protein
MDEPLGALDKQLREKMQIELKHIHQYVGVTFVYVTHDQSEALTMSDRIVVFDDGAVQQLATPEVLYEKPENSFVAQFIGENNRLDGKVTAVNGDTCSVEVDGGMVEALAVNIDGVGSKTLLSLRPESVLINPPAGSCPSNFESRVEELIYLGDHTRVRVSVCGTDDFVIKVPRSAAAPDLAVGRTMNIGWQSKECRALDPM